MNPADHGSIQFFGPPGAGKSFTADRLAEEAGGVVVSRVLYPPYRISGTDRLPFLFREARAKLATRSVLTNREVTRRYEEAARQFLDLGPERYRRGLHRRLVREYRFLMRTRRLAFCDEGLLSAAVWTLANRSPVGDCDPGPLVSALRAYPHDRTAIWVDAAVETCLARQVARQRVVCRSEDEQKRYAESAELLNQVLLDQGWRVERIRN